MLAILIFAGVLGAPSFVFAKEQTTGDDGGESVKTEERVLSDVDSNERARLIDMINDFVDMTHSGVSHGVVSTAKWVDSFFKTDRFDEEHNKTSLKFRFDNYFDEEGNEFKARVKFKLRTPNLNKRMKFFVAGDKGDVNSSLSLDERVGQVFEGTNEDNVSVGLLYRYRETAKKNIKLKGGLRVRDSNLVYFVEPQFRWRENINKWNVYFFQNAGWFSDNGFNINTRFDFDRPQGSNKLFRTTIEGNGYEGVDAYFYSANFSYSHLLNDHKGLSYQWINSFVLHSGSKLAESIIKVAYRQTLWRDWLSLEVAPQVKYPRFYDFEARPGLFLRLEMRFEQIKK